MKKGISAAMLEQQARRMSDTECARNMRDADLLVQLLRQLADTPVAAGCGRLAGGLHNCQPLQVPILWRPTGALGIGQPGEALLGKAPPPAADFHRVDVETLRDLLIGETVAPVFDPTQVASLSFGAALSLRPHPSQGSLGDKASSASCGSLPAFPDSCQSPDLLCCRSVPEGRALRSIGVARLPRYYGPVRLPAGSALLAEDSGVANSTRRDLPFRTAVSLRRHAVPTTPADRAGASVGCFPARAAFPVSQAGRRPRFPFRGLLRLTARYGLPACSPGFLRTLSRGFREADYPAAPLVNFPADRRLHRWAPSSHRVSAPKRRTEKCGLVSSC